MGHRQISTISASTFRTHFYSLLRSIGSEGVVITKRGRPVARLLPLSRSSAHLIGALKGKLRVKGNVFSTGRW